MTTTIVRHNDSASDVAQRSGVSHAALIGANPHKPLMMLGGVPTFRELGVGEVLNVPARLGRVGAPGTLGDPTSDGTANAVLELDGTPALCQTGNPTVLAFQQSWNASQTDPTAQVTEDGDYGPDTAQALSSATGSVAVPAACTSYTSGATAYTQTDLVNAANALIADTTICNGPNANVSSFQTIYNAVTGSTLAIDGEYGPASASALASVSGTTGTMPSACPNYTPSATYTAPPGQSTATPVAPTAPQQPLTNIAINAPPSSNTALVVGLVAAAALGTFGYLHYKKHGTVVPKVVSRRLGPASAHRRLAAGR